MATLLVEMQKLLLPLIILQPDIIALWYYSSVDQSSDVNGQPQDLVAC